MFKGSPLLDKSLNNSKEHTKEGRNDNLRLITPFITKLST